MDKSWTDQPNRFSESYKRGVESFINFAKENAKKSGNLIHCPCRRCNNARFKTFEEVKCHLHVNGFTYNYQQWILHGEPVPVFSENENSENENSTDDDNNAINDEQPELNDGLDDLLEEIEMQQVESEMEGFNKMFENAKIKLYPGSKKSLLSVVVKLLHIKVINKWSNKSFNMLLEFLKEILPEDDTLPSSFYGAKKILDEMGLGYEEIEVCKNDCALFYKENEKNDKCPICDEPRWIFNDSKGRKVPHKKLRHFPLKPRLQRLFMSNQTASDMRWHKDKRMDEVGTMRHPVDSPAWKHFDEQYPHFAQDSRNVRLGLATDGFTPWSNLGNSYSMWPVILVAYNLPPYQSMKEEFLMMSLLIPGPRSPGKDIDVYLRPLIDELKELWDVGALTYDVHSQEKFKMHAALLWTISDFPGYGSISGWTTMGKMACPCCFDQTRSMQIRSKTCFMGHRCYLTRNHPWRKNKTTLNGKEEHRMKPKELSGDDVLLWLNSLCDVFGKPGKHPLINRKRKRTPDEANWVKKSIFFELPYWHRLMIRHNLDVMHIEKNICDNVLGTLLDIKGKTKDNEKARKDLRDLGIREELHMQIRSTDNKHVKPIASYTLSSTEKAGFLQFLKSVKFPDGYAANISRCIKQKQISGLKSHDCHVLLQRLIPAGIRGYLTKEINDALYELGDFFRELCSKTLNVEDLERLKKNIPLILCKLEKIFPPAFFTVMVHLAVHLPLEAKVAGPVQSRWMYPIERYIGTLKGFVHNRTHPESSIAQRYIVKESLTFMSLYLTEIETKFNQQKRNNDRCHIGDVENLSVFTIGARPFGHVNSKSGVFLTDKELEKAHRFILTNCEEVEQFMNIYKAKANSVTLQEANDLEVDERQMQQFPKWFKQRINFLHHQKDVEATDDLWALANGPIKLDTKYYHGCIVNEVCFLTKDHEASRSTQNSGLVVEGNHESGMMEFFGFLKSVVELTYLGNRKIVLFQCEWYDTGSRRTLQVDKHYTSIDVRSRWYKDDIFVLPINVQQVFYVDDMKLGKNWKIVQRVKHRHLWDLPMLKVFNSVNFSGTSNPLQQFESGGVIEVTENEEVPSILVREDLEPEKINETQFHRLKKEKRSHNVEEEDNDVITAGYETENEEEEEDNDISDGYETENEEHHTFEDEVHDSDELSTNEDDEFADSHESEDEDS